MKKLIQLVPLLLSSLSLTAQIGRVGINTTTPAAMLHVKDSSVLFSGGTSISFPQSAPPVSGPGIRMMWYPQKAAFRAGYVTGQQWNKDSIGIYSIALGKNARAIGLNAIALGEQVKADHNWSIALGTNLHVTAQQATAIGHSCKATADYAMAFGAATRASGTFSTSIGYFTVANSENMFVIGRFNDTIASSPSGFNGTDHLFVIGNGLSWALNNAMTVLKNGKTGINTSSPDAMLHVVKDSPVNGPYHSNSAAIFEGDQGSFIQLSTTNTVQSGILAGNLATSIRSALIFASDSSVLIRSGGNTTRMSIEKNGKVGIGTTAPQRLLHVSGGSSGATSASSALAVVENSADASINIITPAANESGLYFGNPANAVHGGIVYNSTVANGLAFRTNGNTTRMVINDLGNVGIGDNTPNAKLHVSDGAGGGTYSADARVIIEDNNNAYLQFSTPTGEAAGVLSGQNGMAVRSGIIFASDSSLLLRAGGNTTRLTIDKSGNSTITGEIRRTPTGPANIVPICYGTIDAAGTILNGTDNFTVTHPSAGYYEVTITGENYSNAGYATNVTAINANPRIISIGSAANNLVVRAWTTAAALIDCGFHFVVYKE